MSLTEARATYVGGPRQWKGAIKVGRKVVWTCPHLHVNRDQWGSYAGQAAQGCSCAVLALAYMGAEKRGEYVQACRRSAAVSGQRVDWMPQVQESARLAEELEPLLCAGRAA